MTVNATGSIGNLIDRDFIEQRTLTHVSTWIVPYLAHVERLKGLTAHSIPPPKSFDVTNEFEKFMENGMPYVAVVSPGLNGSKNPRQDGDGTITAWWTIAVGAVVSAKDMKSAKKVAGYYGAAIRGLMEQMPELQADNVSPNGPWCAGVEWNDERYDDLTRVMERRMAAVRLVFTLEVPDVINLFDGSRDYLGNFVLPIDPYAVPEDYTTVSTADNDVEVDGVSP